MEATKATGYVTIKGSEGAIITIGDKVASDTLDFTAQEEKTIDATGEVVVLVECDQEGSIGNVPVGAIKYFPVTIQGLDEVTNNQAFTTGYRSRNR